MRAEHLFQFEIRDMDMVFCIARAAVLGILVGAEALIARHKREGYQRHLILFASFSLLMAAEILGAVLALADGMSGPSIISDPVIGSLWAWYPVVSIVGLLGVAFCFDYMRVFRQNEGTAVTGGVTRRFSRRYLMAAAGLLALGSLLSSMEFSNQGPATAVFHMDATSFLLHGIQAIVMLMLAWKTHSMAGIWLSPSESRVFVLGCVTGAFGALVQIYAGAHEHFTTLAFSIMVAVFLRDNYRRTEHEAAIALEDRNAKSLLFHRVTTQLKSTFDAEELYPILMDSLVSNLGAESAAIYISATPDSPLMPVLVHGPYPPPLPLAEEEMPGNWQSIRDLIERTPIPANEGVIGKLVEDGLPLYLFDKEGVERHYTWPTGPVNVRTTIALPLRSPDRIYGAVQVVNRLDGAAFSEDDVRFMNLLVEQAGLAINNAWYHDRILNQQRTNEQIKIARQIQLRLIPVELPSFPGLALGAEYEAAQEVGGDYFDFYRIDHDHIGIVVFDVAGKGVPGALLMAITSTFLKMAAPRSTSPAWVLNEVNAALSAEMRRGLYVTAIYGVLQLSSREFTFCCAGHTDTLLIREKDLKCDWLNPGGAALGLLRPNRFRAVLEQQTICLEPGDTLLMYTDGVTEAMNEAGEAFGDERLAELGRQHMRQGPGPLAAEVARAVSAHAGARPQYDDITLVALSFAGSPEESS